MKQSIKIGIIVFTAIAIVGLLFYFTKKIDNAEVEKIEPQNFVKYVEQQANKEIKNEPFEEAKSSFYKLIGEINTEAFVWLNDSTKALTDESIQKCKRIAFYEYAPIFTAHGIGYFNQESWTIKDADALRDEANVLLAYGIAENGTQVKAELDQIVKNTKEYHEALGVISSASGCGTVEAVNNVVSKSRKYYHNPLDNNKKLISDLNHVPIVAKESLANRIVARADGIIARKCSYADYPQWFDAKEQTVNAIEEYEKAFGKVDKLTDERTKLEQADEEALDCYD